MQRKYQKLLQDRIEKGSERSLLSFDESFIDFWSNDYLGLGRKSNTIDLKSGSGSRLISGNSRIIESIEDFLANHFESEAALIFNSGYDANLGFFSSVPQKGDIILYDELIHASVRDGIRLSFANAFSFQHNSLEDLKKKLDKANGTVFVAIESIYSMDGDLAPLKEIYDLCEQFGVLLIVDEAHAGGVFGSEGKGLCHEVGIEPFARLFTFGKGFGAHGAAILSNEEIKRFLINFARSFIYTTAFPEAFYQHIQTQVEAAKDNNLRLELQKNIALFRSEFPYLKSAINSPIQVIEIPDVEKCKDLAQKLQENGFAVKAILPPTVPEGGQRLRICIHQFNSESEIKKMKFLIFNS
ncbi:MAG: aminotransferase class I/II-fold pyridoxal phosphate-dependent enzyme [Fluviicola sp.]